MGMSASRRDALLCERAARLGTLEERQDRFAQARRQLQEQAGTALDDVAWELQRTQDRTPSGVVSPALAYEAEQVYGELQRFSMACEDELQRLSVRMREVDDQIDETIRTYARRLDD